MRGNVKERREVTLLGRRQACSPKEECKKISKTELWECNKGVKEGIGLKGTKGVVRRFSRIS